MVFYWSLSDINTPPFSTILRRIPADRNNVVVWMILIRSLFSYSSILFSSSLRIATSVCIFPAAIVSILQYGCTTWTLTKRMEKKLDGYYTRMLQIILNKSWRQHPTKQQLYGHLPPITKTLQVRQNRHAGHYWRSKDELISDVLLWNPSHGRANVGWPAWTYIQQLCEDMGTSRKRWTIGRGGERGSGISVLMARQDDGDKRTNYKWNHSYTSTALLVLRQSLSTFFLLPLIFTQWSAETVKSTVR